MCYLLRVEQLYPFPLKSACARRLRRFKNADVVWCQEEPQNMGAWILRGSLISNGCSTHARLAAKRPRYVGRAGARPPPLD